MASTRGLVGAMCYHLGGDKNVVWKVRVNRSSKDGEEVEIQACGGDMFVTVYLQGRGFVQLIYPKFSLPTLAVAFQAFPPDNTTQRYLSNRYFIFMERVLETRRTGSVDKQQAS